MMQKVMNMLLIVILAPCIQMPNYGVYVGTHADYRPKISPNNLAEGKVNSLNHGKRQYFRR